MLLFVKYLREKRIEDSNFKTYIIGKKLYFLKRKNRGSKIKNIFFQKKAKKKKIYFFNKKKVFKSKKIKI
jgi:hypothetical protein